MVFILAPIREEDTLSWTRVRAQAYRGPTNDLVHTGPISEESIMKVAEDRRREIGRPNTWQWKIVDTELSPSDGDPEDNGGKTIAVAVWSAHNIPPLESENMNGARVGNSDSVDQPTSDPTERAEPKEDNAPPFIPPEVKIEVLQGLFNPIRAAKEEIMGTKPYMMLNALATLWEHHKRGAGSMLIQWGVDKADELGVEAYLDGTTIGKSLYEKHGFEVAKEVVFDRTEFGGEGQESHWCMVRKPKEQSDT
ncbi:hypothetical protein CC78DRAFT_336922 [Lojkania enalia]|uniref:N-acetyltransferase domain-containing protein n=1 Tax=Lojkania enalia TaxID=147567 RepID=A0A9P4N121_9PLEO|nr:hypothetical protein CC78DRAFT_336922 [Didymosphaeria enalia]